MIRKVRKEKNGDIYVGQDTSLGDGHASEELVELFVVADGELDQNLTKKTVQWF